MLLTEQYLTHRQYISRHNISLMQLHEFNHKLLNHLLPAQLSEASTYVSNVDDKPTLQVTIRERFKFTTELSMCMVFDQAVSDALVIRIYHDAQLAELIYSNEFEKQYRQMGGQVDIKNQASLRFSQNCFLNKWLIYLLQNGFCQSNWVKTE
ncbi:DUF1249 domain-containing protein [Marinicella sp. S1101]|uniref:DUF1249 domain-containing protein n=1 Tax=Marinicella marina TaxID=2996016 RepID=UPI002260BCFF|nr:DUF1249 domain-containing protein [Marinicella marina]MCX7554450.1 DUF1249 domain-containing protein [Marinicella marina]MDJ1140601.1 DUF1249 domain-containing protein [Marinicella marina]